MLQRKQNNSWRQQNGQLDKAAEFIKELRCVADAVSCGIPIHKVRVLSDTPKPVYRPSGGDHVYTLFESDVDNLEAFRTWWWKNFRFEESVQSLFETETMAATLVRESFSHIQTTLRHI